MQTKTNRVINEAKRLLAANAYDAAHDLAHHESVYATARDIGAHIAETHDPYILRIACMWHDVVSRSYEVINHKEVTADTAAYLQNFMIESGFTKTQAEQAALAVKHHEFDDTPVNIEGRILFDADKLDNLNLERVRRFIASDQMGEVPKWKMRLYIRSGVAIIKTTRDKFHFKYSKKIFDERVDQLWNDKEVAGYAKEYGVDLDDIKKALQRSTTIFDKLVGLVKR